MSKGKEAGKIQVYVRVRPFTEREKEKREANAIEIHQEHSLIRVLDPRSRTNYFFDGVFSPEATNQELYLKVGKPLVYAALNGYKGTLLTYGQTGTGKTFTLLSDDGITTRVVQHCFEKIDNDEIHTYKVMCSFLQVYQEKVYDLLNPRFIVDLPVREHPKKGVYVANLTQHEVKSAGDVFALLEIGKQHLVIAETKMVRHSSRSHSIMQLIVERRLKAHIANEKPPSQTETAVSHEAVQESIMAVDETINNLIKELKQERKSHHKHERECLKELMEKELNNGNNFEGDLIVKGKINLCDLAGSERLTKTKAEGVRLTEAKYLNTSLLELGNVIYALARGHKRHVPYRNSTLTRLLQDCLGDNGKTNFIICIAPSLSEVNETKCSLNFGLRAMRITNVARLNVEVDYKVLAERLAKKLEDHDIKYKFEKLEYLREIQRLKSAISCYQESENFAGKDHEKLVSVIANLSKSVQREKEEKNNLQTELVCLKKQVSQPSGNNTPDVEAVLLAELMSMELLANLQTPDVTKSILTDSSLQAKIKSHLALADTQEALLNNAGCFLQLLDLHLDSEQDKNGRNLATTDGKDYVQFNFSRAGSVELFSKDCSIKISPRGAPQEPCLSLPMCGPSSDESAAGLAGGVRRMLGKLIGRDTKDRTAVSPDAHSTIRTSSNEPSTAPGKDKARMRDQEDAMAKTKALLKQLTNSKEKVEQQVLNLMSSLFEEQIDRDEGQSPQWNELGKKLSRLILFRRNNMPGLSDADLWTNSEDLNSVLENCLRFVIIDKALLACLLVIELLDLRQACGKLEDRRQFPSALTGVNGMAKERPSSADKSQEEKSSVKGNTKPSGGTNGNKKITLSGQEIMMNSSKGAASPRREKLTSLKHTKTELEKEINEMHEDTTKLETELFSTIEEKTKVEEELFGMKHQVTKLRSELFHLKLEKSNLEKDVKKSKSQENLQQCQDTDETKLNVESPKEALRGYPELSDVMEASHESNDSENSSQMSDGNDNREAFLKTCMENISKIYSFIPNPDEIASEDELSDDQEPTLSDANIDDSDEEIIITKLARSLRSPSTSPVKEKSFEATSPNRSANKEDFSGLKALMGNENGDDLGSKSKEALIKQIQELKRKLHKVEQQLAETQETCEDLEEELDHKKGQLAEAQETITNLENQVVEEKETCEQVRHEYFNVKNHNEILEEKIKAVRAELEKVLVRENNILTESARKDHPPPSPTKTSVKSPLKSPGKSKVGKIDLRFPPPKQVTSNEMEVVGLIEENAELKVKFEKATQEKARLEKSQKLVEDKATKTKAALQASEDSCSRLKNDVTVLTKEKIKLTEEMTELRNNNSTITEELQRYREKSTRLEKDIEAIAYMSTRLEKDNKTLEMEISKMESELSSWKSKHEAVTQELQSLNQERIQLDKEYEKALHGLDALRKEKDQLLEQRFSNDKENKRRNEELKNKEERFYELESEVSEQKRLNSNLHKELAGMAEYQEALEKEYSKAKNEEDRLKQALDKVSSRAVEVETELAIVTQNSHDEAVLKKAVKTFKGTPSKKFYTITHTSEDEIGDTSSSIAESPADESKQVEHENQLLKLENSYLQQQLAESEHVLAMYRQDLEMAHDLIDKLRGDIKVKDVDAKNTVVEEDCRTPSDKDDTIKEIGDCLENASDEYKLLEEKHAELTREYELLRAQYQDALTERVSSDKTKENKRLNQGSVTEDKIDEEVSNSREAVSHLQERIQQLEIEKSQLKKTSDELTQNAETATNALLKSLEDEKRVKLTLEEKINKLESEKEMLRKKGEVTGLPKGRKFVRRLSLDDESTSSKDEIEALKPQMPQCTGVSHSHPVQLQKTCKGHDSGKITGDYEVKMQQLEEDLLKVTSEKLKLEFELRTAKSDCERLRSDLHHSESERTLLNTQLDDNIEKAANLEIRLMEMRCSCETIKDEINTLKNEKRQESFHLHEASVCKEILEKRLEDALKENNVLRHELDTLREERKENEKKSAKLEKDKDQLAKEIEDVKTQIRKLEQDFEENQDRSVETEVHEDRMRKENYFLDNASEYKKLHEQDQEQLKILQEEVQNLTVQHDQITTELEETKNVKANLEKQLEDLKNRTEESCGRTGPATNEETSGVQNENMPECERTTFDTLEIQKHTRLLEKEKGFLEKELTRVQEECNNLKDKLEVIKQASENVQTQEARRMELEDKQEQLERELQELRELNQKLESECDDSHKLINQLEIKTKALESLQKELRCFHEENDRLTHEVDIIHHTSKAMSDHQRTKESLEKENCSLKQELDCIKHSNRKLQLQTEDLSRELATFKDKSQSVSSTERISTSLQSEVEKLQKIQQHLEGELASTREKTKELENVNESLKKENKAVKGRIKSLEQRNEELRRKDEKKKASIVENKLKGKPKQGQNVVKESKEIQTVESNCVKETEKYLQDTVGQLKNEKIQLEKQLNNLKEKVNGECAAVQTAPGVTIGTQTTELPKEEKAVKTMEEASSSITIDQDQEINMEQKREDESTPLEEDIKIGFSIMAKEKLLLERKAAHFNRAQMQLEQSFAKAMRENAALKMKVDEAENVLGVLREKLQELEKKNSTFLPIADLKQNVVLSSDSENDSEEEVATTSALKEIQKENKDIDYPSNAKESTISSSSSDDNCHSSPTQHKSEHLRNEKEQPLKDMTSQKKEVDSPQSTGVSGTSHEQISTKSDTNDNLKSGKADSEREWKLTKENVEAPEETEEGEQLLNNDVVSGLNPTISEVDQPRNEKEQQVREVEGDKSDEGKIEIDIKQQRDSRGLINKSQTELHPSATTNMSTPIQYEIHQLAIEKERLLKELEELRSQTLQLESELKQKEDNLDISKDDTERLFAKHEEEITLLKQERKTLLEELEEARNQRNLTENELRHNKESCLKQEQEIKLLLSSYTQEKESLLRELENTKSDCRQAKEKIRELQRIELEFEDIQKKSKEAEKLIIELEKDLLSQTEMKNELRRELQTCKSKLQEIEQLETQLRACRTENEDLLETNTHLMEEIRKWKDDPDVKTTTLQSPKLGKQRMSFLNVNPSMKRLVNDQHVQTESAIEHYVDRNEKCSEENAPPNLQDSFNVDLRQENKTDDVSRTPDDREARTAFHKTYKYETKGPAVKPEQTESEQTIHKNDEVEVTTTIRREGTLGGVHIPVIIVSHVDDVETIIQKDRAASLSLCIQDFERDSPNDQSTPDQETMAIKTSIENENTTNIPISGQKEKVPLATGLSHTTVGIENVHQPSQKALEVRLSQDAGVENPNLESKKHHNLHLESPVHLAAEIGPLKQIFNSDMEARLIDIEEDVLKSRRELEWTISRLKSELLQRSEENEKSQHEISSLVEEQLSMKREISSLLNECESLRGNVAILQTQNEAVLKEQILNDEENEELQQNLQDLVKERNAIEEAKRNLESQKARLEIELSDAIETREAMERELLRIRSEDRDVSRQRLEQQLHDTSERYAKLETVLSCVLDENSKMNAEISVLHAENSMLKSFKIMEITDNCTQISPNNTEDEGDEKEKQPVSSGNSTPRHPLSLGDEGDCENSVTLGQVQDEERINKDELSVTPIASNPTSTDPTVTPIENGFDDGTKTKRGRVISTDHGNIKERQKASRVGTPLSSAGSMANKQQRKHQRNHSRDNSSLRHQRSAPEEASRWDSEDNDSSMEVHTDSSLVSATDLDMSISSDQISSEDSSVVGTEIRVLQKMQKELAETKCSNVLIKNELSIVRKHNSDLQNQVQKLLSRNNHLKTKMCDRTLSVKRMEKEMSSIKEENNRLQQQALVLQEEMARLEKDKAKLERNVSSTKSENKRLKSDLSNVKAESYRTMKELVNLQSENRRLQLEIERFRDEARSFKSGFSDESISQELSSWGSMSHGDFRGTSRRSLQERPTKPEPAYFQQRAASDLNFSPRQRQAESLETPELSPLNLSKELHNQHADGEDYGKRLTTPDTISVNSAGGSRREDPVSRRGSPLSFTSEASLPSETDENDHNSEKAEQQHDQDEEEGKGKNKKKIKTILRKLQHSKKSKSSK